MEGSPGGNLRTTDSTGTSRTGSPRRARDDGGAFGQECGATPLIGPWGRRAWGAGRDAEKDGNSSGVSTSDRVCLRERRAAEQGYLKLSKPEYLVGGRNVRSAIIGARFRSFCPVLGGHEESSRVAGSKEIGDATCESGACVRRPVVDDRDRSPLLESQDCARRARRRWRPRHTPRCGRGFRSPGCGPVLDTEDLEDRCLWTPHGAGAGVPNPRLPSSVSWGHLGLCGSSLVRSGAWSGSHDLASPSTVTLAGGRGDRRVPPNELKLSRPGRAGASRLGPRVWSTRGGRSPALDRGRRRS
jgi:hypothetical protein